MFFKNTPKTSTIVSNARGYLSSMCNRVHNIKMTLGEYGVSRNSKEAPYTGTRYDHYDPYQRYQTMDLDVEEYLMELDEEPEELEYIKSSSTVKMSTKQHAEAVEAILKDLALKQEEEIRNLMARRAAIGLI